jgi:hypothetical protein
MVVRFVCTTSDKKKYYLIKEKIFFSRATIIREKVRDLKDEFFAEFEVLSQGRFLYMDLKSSGLCHHLRLDPNTKDEDE